MVTRRFILSSFAFASWLALCPGAFAQQTMVDVQYRRKADMLYPLAASIQSESGLADGGDTLVIGVVGKDMFQGVNRAGMPTNHLDDAVAESNGRVATSKRKKIAVKRFASVKDYTPCHVLWVSAQPAATSDEKTLDQRLAAAIEKTKESPVLICTDVEGYARKGSMLNFYVGTDAAGVQKVMFEFNPDAAKRAGFTKIDPGIYRLAKVVRDDETAENTGREAR
jgi:hypothetical protein